MSWEGVSRWFACRGEGSGGVTATGTMRLWGAEGASVGVRGGSLSECCFAAASVLGAASSGAACTRNFTVQNRMYELGLEGLTGSRWSEGRATHDCHLI